MITLIGILECFEFGILFWFFQMQSYLFVFWAYLLFLSPEVFPTLTGFSSLLIGIRFHLVGARDLIDFGKITCWREINFFLPSWRLLMLHFLQFCLNWPIFEFDSGKNLYDWGGGIIGTECLSMQVFDLNGFPGLCPIYNLAALHQVALGGDY